MIQISTKLQPLILSKNHYLLLLLGIVSFYALLTVPSLDRMGIGWDEEIDLRIAHAYLTPRGFFLGLPLDLSQTRLPMFSVAFVYWLSGTSSLFLARLTSVLVGGLTLFGIYIYGKDYINLKVGLLAAGLLALNPFFLSFARLAFTESDVYLAFTLTWLLVAIARLLDKPTPGRAAVAGLFLGLAISAKAIALTIIPAIWVILVSVRFAKQNNRPAQSNMPIATKIPGRVVLFWAGWVILVLLVGVYIAGFLEVGAYSGTYRTLNYGLVGVGWLVTLVWAYRYKNQRADLISLAAYITAFGLLTFVIFPPDHLTNSGILRSIFSRANEEMSFNVAFMGELAALHLLTLFFKSTPLLGLSLLVCSVTGLAEWRRREMMLPLFIALSYFAGLLLLPLGQTFYTLPILPMLSLLLAEKFLRLWAFRRNIVITIAVLGIGWWGFEIAQCYPDYHLNGYQWVGERVLFGRSSIGYRSVVYTPSDGIQQAVDWLNTHAKLNQVAQLYVSEWHVVRYIAPDPDYHLTNGFEGHISSQPDYVVLHINALLQQGHGTETPEGDVVRYPFDYDVLTREYEKVFKVNRAFGIEMASVWERK